MKSIQIIAKLRKKEIDDLQNQISQVYNLIQNLENKKNDYIESMNKQTDFLNNNQSFVFDSKSFFDFVDAEITKINCELKSYNEIIEQLSDKLLDAFFELKKIEVYIKNLNIKKSEKLAKKEIELMNEIALMNFFRNK